MGKVQLQNFLRKGVVEAGCDEAGRGPLAGPVFAAAVILPPDFSHPLLNDSKQMTPQAREELRPVIEQAAIAWAVAAVSAGEIDRINILNASIAGMQRAVMSLGVVPEQLLIDGNRFRPFSYIEGLCAWAAEPQLFGSERSDEQSGEWRGELSGQRRGEQSGELSGQRRGEQSGEQSVQWREQKGERGGMWSGAAAANEGSHRKATMAADVDVANEGAANEGAADGRAAWRGAQGGVWTAAGFSAGLGQTPAAGDRTAAGSLRVPTAGDRAIAGFSAGSSIAARIALYDRIPYSCIVKGDAKFASIAAASVLAKTYRDACMRRLAEEYPDYGWDKNFGYPTPAHIEAIHRHGFTPYHRRSFHVG